MRCEALVSRLATFRVSVGWRVRVCGALTGAYPCQGAVVVGLGVCVIVAVCDTACGVSLRPVPLAMCAGCGG